MNNRQSNSIDGQINIIDSLSEYDSSEQSWSAK